MPYQMIHLLIADEFAQKHPNLLQSAEYYLGNIAPDAIHARRESTTAVEKYGTHLKPTGPDGLREVMAYWSEQKKSPFHVGYGMHVITDRLWTRHYPSVFPAVMRADGSTKTDIYRPDAEWIDWVLFERSPGAKRLLNLLQTAAPPASHPYLTSDEISRWRTIVIERYQGGGPSSTGLPVVMTVEATVAFMRGAVEKLHALMGVI